MKKILRIIDANFNRGREGLRVIEDALRFYYSFNISDINRLKVLRHSFSKEVAKNFGLTNLKASRDVSRDKGKKLDIRKLEDIQTTVEKNFLRASEAIRTIEEYSKTVVPEASEVFHNLRFELYKIEQEVSLKICRKTLPAHFYYIIYDIADTDKISVPLVKKLLTLKPDAIEIKFSGNSFKTYLKNAKSLRKLIPSKVLYIVNSRADVCQLSQADGLILESNDIPIEDAKRLLPNKMIGFRVEKIKKRFLCPQKQLDFLVILCQSDNNLNKIQLTETLNKVNIPFAIIENSDKKKMLSYVKKRVFLTSEEEVLLQKQITLTSKKWRNKQNER